MESGAKTPGAVVAEMRARAESTAKVDPAARLYTAYFLRRPDAAGLRYWIAQLRAGRSNRWVAEFFARSPEFQQRYGTLTNREFVELIYRNILGRPGEASGVEFWTGRLDAGANTRGWVMVGFSESAEYARDQASEVEVAVLYTLLLGRAPTLAEYTADVGTPRRRHHRRRPRRPHHHQHRVHRPGAHHDHTNAPAAAPPLVRSLCPPRS